MKLQSSKNGSNFVCEKGTFSQIRSHIWNQSGGIHSLWNSLLDDLKVSKPRGGVSHGLYCKARALFWAREGRYSNALQAL